MDDKLKDQIDDKKENSTKNDDIKPEDNQKEIKKEDNEKKSEKQTSETKLKEIITTTTTDQKNDESNDEFNNALELIRAHLKCIEKLQHVIVKNLFNEKTTTNSSMSIKLECLDDQNYLTMETNFLTRTKIPNFF